MTGEIHVKKGERPGEDSPRAHSHRLSQYEDILSCLRDDLDTQTAAFQSGFEGAKEGSELLHSLLQSRLHGLA